MRANTDGESAALPSSAAKRRLRTTIVIEHESQEDFEKALAQGVQCARERFIHISFGLKGKDEHGPRVEVRTTRCRRRP